MATPLRSLELQVRQPAAALIQQGTGTPATSCDGIRDPASSLFYPAAVKFASGPDLLCFAVVASDPAGSCAPSPCLLCFERLLASSSASLAPAAVPVLQNRAGERSPVPVDFVVPRVGHDGAKAQQRFSFVNPNRQACSQLHRVGQAHASVSFRSCEDSFDYIRLSSSWTRSSSLRDFSLQVPMKPCRCR